MNKKSNYLEESRKWIFRLYTIQEVCKILRVTRDEIYKLKKNGLFKPMHRRVDFKMGGMIFFTDRQVYEGIIYLNPDIADIEMDYLESQITEVPDNATFKERRRAKRIRKTKEEGIEERSARLKGNKGGEVRGNKGKQTKWIERDNSYTEKPSADRLSERSGNGNNPKNRGTSKVRDAKGHRETQGKSVSSEQDSSRFNKE